MTRTLTALFAGAALALAPAAPARAAARPDPLVAGSPMPRLAGRRLTGQPGALPDAARGRVAVVLLGFSYRSRSAVEAWTDRLRGPGAVDSARVMLFEAPMLGGAARLAAPFIESGMRRGTAPALRERVLVVTDGVGDWKARVGWSAAARDDAYLLVIDREGTVRWRGHGAVDAPRLAEVVGAIARAAGEDGARAP